MLNHRAQSGRLAMENNLLDERKEIIEMYRKGLIDEFTLKDKLFYNQTMKGGIDEMETQTKTANWLDEEIKTLNTNANFGEKLPALKLEEKKITEFTVDFSQPFNKYVNTDGTIKKIIPVIHKGERKNLWLNVKNPLYGQLCEAGKKGQTVFKVSTTGTLKDTRYTIVTED